MKPKIPPVLHLIAAAILSWGLSKYLPEFNFNFQGQKLLSYLFSATCFLVLAAALYQFQKAKTTTDPLNPNRASGLVTNGIFSYSRNPMYLSMLLLLVGLVIRLGNPISLAGVFLFVFSINQFQIKIEEKVLADLFGEEYALYFSRTRRWI